MDGYYADQDCKTANGLFYYFHPNRSLQSTGSYVNDKRKPYGLDITRIG